MLLFQDLKTPTVLLGYDALADADNQFYICVTETAQNAVVEILQQMQEDQQKWLQNALEKPANPWVSLGSEQEVDLFTVRQGRPLVSFSVGILTLLFYLYWACHCYGKWKWLSVYLKQMKNMKFLLKTINFRCRCKLKLLLLTLGNRITLETEILMMFLMAISNFSIEMTYRSTYRDYELIKEFRYQS